MKRFFLTLAFALPIFAQSGEFVSWDASPSGDMVTSYRLYWSTNVAAPFPWQLIATVGSTNLSCAGSTNTASRNFYYCTAVSSFGLESVPSNIATLPPGKVQHVKAQ